MFNLTTNASKKLLPHIISTALNLGRFSERWSHWWIRTSEAPLVGIHSSSGVLGAWSVLDGFEGADDLTSILCNVRVPPDRVLIGKWMWVRRSWCPQILPFTYLLLRRPSSPCTPDAETLYENWRTLVVVVNLCAVVLLGKGGLNQRR